MLGFSFSCLTAWGVSAREKKGKEGKGRKRKAADGVVARGWLAMGGEKGDEEAAGDERAWLRGRLRTAWVQGSGWKWVGRRGRWG